MTIYEPGLCGTFGVFNTQFSRADHISSGQTGRNGRNNDPRRRRISLLRTGDYFQKKTCIRVFFFAEKAAIWGAVHDRPKNENNPVAHMVLKIFLIIEDFSWFFNLKRTL